MHIGVFGSPGKGKSYLSGVVMEEAHAWGVPMLALDLNGEFIEAAQALGGLVIRLPDRERFGLALSLLSSRELVSIAPNVQLGTQYAELIEIAHDRLKGGGGNITFDALEEIMTELAHSLKMANTSAAAARNRVNALRNDPLLVRKGASFDFIAELAKHRLVVLDCRLLTLRQTQLIAAAAARRLQAHGRTMTTAANAGDAEAAKWFSLLLIIDEAHAVAPNSENVFFIGAIPRLDHGHCLPRIEMLVPFSTREDDAPWEAMAPFARMVLTAFREIGFEVAADHDMFDAKGRLDIMPKLLIDVHNTVKQWSALLYARAQEHIAFQISGFLKGRRKEARIRPWKRHELEAWLQQMTREREGRLTGTSDPHVAGAGRPRLKGPKDAA